MTLQIPICSFDAKTGLLCPSCQTKMDTGRISLADVQVSKVLVALSERLRTTNKEGHHLLDSVSLIKSWEVEGDYLLEVRAGGLTALRDDLVHDELERTLRGRVWVTGTASSNRQFIEDLTYPSTIAALSTLWLPDGTKVSKAIIESGSGKMNKRLEVVRRLAKAARGVDLLLECAPADPRAREESGFRGDREIWNSADSRPVPRGREMDREPERAMVAHENALRPR